MKNKLFTALALSSIFATVRPAETGTENLKIGSPSLRSSIKSEALFTEKEYQTYCAVRRLADLVLLAAIKLNKNPRYPRIINYFDDRRNEGVNPYWNRTQQGLYLEFYYNHPSSIHTPWGKWDFNGSSSSFPKYEDMNHPAWDTLKTTRDDHEFHKEVLQQVGVELTLDVPGKQTDFGYFGPYYKVKSIEKYNLPLAHKASNKTFSNAEYEITSEIARNKWKSMTQRYNLEKYDEICAEFSKFYDHLWNQRIELC